MIFKREEYSMKLMNEMKHLWVDHYEEVAMFKDIPLDPDFALYERIHTIGSLRVYTIRKEEKILGYQFFFVNKNPHYQKSLQANQDILFLDKKIRKGLTGYRFIKWCDEELRKEGVQVVYQHVKVAHDFTALLSRIGYERHDIVMSRRLF